MSTLVAKTNLYMLLSLFLVQFLWRAKQSSSPLVLFVSYVLPLKCLGEAGSWNIVVLISAETQWRHQDTALGQLSAHYSFVPQFNSYSALTIPALFSGTLTIIRRVWIHWAAVHVVGGGIRCGICVVWHLAVIYIGCPGRRNVHQPSPAQT